MVSEPLSGGIVLAAAGAGIAVGGFFGPLNFPLADFGWATVFAVLGVLGRAVLDAKDAREAARAKGAEKLPVFDFVSFAYGMFGAPLMGGIALASVRAIGFFPDYAAAPVIMGMGYMGRDGINLVIGTARDIVSKRTGGNRD